MRRPRIKAEGALRRAQGRPDITTWACSRCGTYACSQCPAPDQKRYARPALSSVCPDRVQLRRRWLSSGLERSYPRLDIR